MVNVDRLKESQEEKGLKKRDIVYSSQTQRTKIKTEKEFFDDKQPRIPDSNDDGTSKRYRPPPSSKYFWKDSYIQFKYAILAKAGMRPQSEIGDILDSKYTQDITYRRDLSTKEYKVFYDNARRKGIISYRGTKVNNPKDIRSDKNILTDNEEQDKRFKQSIKAFEKVENVLGSNLETVGTSLGGSLAMYVAEDKDTDAYAYNPGISPIKKQNKHFNSDREGHSYIWRTLNDIVSFGALTNKQSDDRVIMELTPKADSDLLNTHFIDQFIPSSSGAIIDRKSRAETLNELDNDINELVEKGSEIFASPAGTLVSSIIDAMKSYGQSGENASEASRVLARAGASLTEGFTEIFSNLPLNQIDNVEDLYEAIREGDIAKGAKTGVQMLTEYLVDYGIQSMAATALEASAIASPLVFLAAGFYIAAPELQEALPKAWDNMKSVFGDLAEKAPEHVKESFVNAGEALLNADETFERGFDRAGRALMNITDNFEQRNKGVGEVNEDPVGSAGENLRNDNLNLPSFGEMWQNITDAFSDI